MTTILVTGVGAIIGYGVLRSLRQSGIQARLIGADVSPSAVGQAWCDQLVVAPYTHTERYASWLADVLTAHGVDLLIPGIEQDVLYLADHPEVSAHTRVALNAPDLIRLSTDKGAMDAELVQLRSAARIPTRFEGSFESLAEDLGVPFLVKPRRSSASKGLLKISDRDEFSSLQHRLGTELIAQPIVGDDASEFTVGVFGDGHGNVSASIALHRLLAKDGSTLEAWLHREVSLDVVVSDLCRHFKPLGPTNLQFRRTTSGWKLLEINPRISSSTSIRTALGYNDALMCVEHFLEGKPITQPALREGHIKRYIEDLVVHDRSDR